MRLVERLRNSLRHDGPAITLWKLLVRLCRPVGEVAVEILLAKDLSADIPPRTARVPIEIRRLAKRDVAWIAAEMARADARDRNMIGLANSSEANLVAHFSERLGRGDSGFIALCDGILAHINWTCLDWGEALPGMPIVLEPGEVYTTDAFTLPAWRGKGIHEAVLSEMLRSAARAGNRRAFTLVDLENARSRRGVLRTGWQTYGVAFYIKLRGSERILLFRLHGRLDPILRRARDKPKALP
jgi:GNAT superfamily N-acetyltransferase